MQDDSPKTITQRLLAALQEDEFVLYTQAITPLEPGAETRAFQEIFIRFREEDAKMLPPGSFFPLLEEYRMLRYLDRWVVNRLARWVRNALKLLPDWEMPRYNVNISDETLLDDKFAPYLMQYVEKSYLSGGVLGFDISFSSALEHREPLRRLLSQVRPHGCTLTLAGYEENESSLDLVLDLKPEFVKINATSVNPARVAAINQKCHSLNVMTIAEYVENEKVLEHLRRSKTDFAQGYAVSPVEEL